jgi:monofunctional biosynthetic peptidoglycan transglycosylase
MSGKFDSPARQYFSGAAGRVPRLLEGLGGWQAAVATVGITDLAADHRAKRNKPDACSTMPESVKLMLTQP